MEDFSAACGFPEGIHRINGPLEPCLNRLKSLGEVFVQARNFGGVLGNSITAREPIFDDELHSAFDPEGGFSLSLDDLRGVVAGDLPKIPVKFTPPHTSTAGSLSPAGTPC